MIGKKMTEALNGQTNAEMYSAYLYLSMSAYFDSVKLPGCAHWMRVQAQEEMVHAMKLFDHVNERGGRNILRAIDAPPTEWDSPLAVFQATRAHERKVTGLINGLVDLARTEGDGATAEFLQWFVKEQEEEEESAEDVVRRTEQAGSSPQGLAALDRELARRTFTPPKTSKAKGGAE